MERFESLLVNTPNGQLCLNKFNSGIWLHNDLYRGYDNICFNETPETYRYFWRLNVGDKFNEIVRELIDIDVQMILSDEPVPGDVRAFEECFSGLFVPTEDDYTLFGEEPEQGGPVEVEVEEDCDGLPIVPGVISDCDKE